MGFGKHYLKGFKNRFQKVLSVSRRITIKNALKLKKRGKNMQVDRKSLYIVKGYETGRDIIKSYATPICIIDGFKIITSDKKYSTTTSKHKSHIIKTLYKGYQVIEIPHKTLKEIIMSEGVNIGRM
jgi:hypothetical protein